MRSSRIRSLLLVSVSVLALAIFQVEASAEEAAAVVSDAKDSFSLSLDVGTVLLSDGALDLSGALDGLILPPATSYGAAFKYRPALSPWVFGVHVRAGKSHRHKHAHRLDQQVVSTTTKSVVTNTNTHQNTHLNTSITTTTTTTTSTTTTSSSSSTPVTTTRTYTHQNPHTHINSTITTTTSTTTTKETKTNTHTHQVAVETNTSEDRSTDYKIIDFSAGLDVGLGRTQFGDPVLQFEGGVRVAHMGAVDTFSEETIVDGLTTDSRSYVAKRRFRGAGPRLGLAASLPVGTSPFTVDGAVGGSLLYGETHVRRTDVINSVTTQLTADTMRFVPAVDASIAVTYHAAPNMSLSLGYSAESYFGAFEGNGDDPASGSGDADMLIQGLFGRVTVKF